VSGVRWEGVREICEEQIRRANEPYPATRKAEADRNVRAHGAALALAAVMLALLDGTATLPTRPRKARRR
jgi:hypothetical protein